MHLVRMLVLLVAVTALVGCDHATKHWAVEHLRSQPSKTLVPGVLELTYAENHDVAFNLLRRIPSPMRTRLVLAVGGAVVAGVAFYWASAFGRRRRTERRARAEELGFALVVGGAVGNLGDRIMRGHVVDFIHLERWPIFNVADMLIVAGAVLLIIAAAVGEPRRPLERA